MGLSSLGEEQTQMLALLRVRPLRHVEHVAAEVQVAQTGMHGGQLLPAR